MVAGPREGHCPSDHRVLRTAGALSTLPHEASEASGAGGQRNRKGEHLYLKDGTGLHSA